MRLAPGDVAVLNDPYRGGTHLPDITMVAPVFLPGRAHRPHSTLPIVPITPTSAACIPAPWDRVAKSPRKASASLPSNSCMPAKWTRRLLAAHPHQRAHPHGARRRPHRATRRLPHRCPAHDRTRGRFGHVRLMRGVREMLSGSERLMRELLAALPAGDWHAEDFLDDDGVLPRPYRHSCHRSQRSRSPPCHRRLRRLRPASSRQPQCRLRHHLVGSLLCLPLPLA